MLLNVVFDKIWNIFKVCVLEVGFIVVIEGDLLEKNLRVEVIFCFFYC